MLATGLGWQVSVLDLEFHAFGVEPQAVQRLGRAKHETGVSLSRSNRRSKRTARISKTLMCNLSKRCQIIQDWMAKPKGSTIKSMSVFGGAYRDRTDDPLLAKQVLSQLS